MSLCGDDEINESDDNNNYSARQSRYWRRRDSSIRSYGSVGESESQRWHQRTGKQRKKDENYIKIAHFLI